MITRGEKIKAGIFFLSGVAILLGFLLLMGYLQGGPGGVQYSSLFDGVRSLREGAPVKFNGVEVGEVKSIKIAESDPGKVQVDYLVEHPHVRHINGNTVAQLVYLSPLSGQQCISLSPARPLDGEKEGRLRSGETIPTRPSDVAATVETIQQSLKNMNNLLSENREHVADLLKNTDKVMRSFRVLVGEPPPEGEKSVGLIGLTNQLAEMMPRLKKISQSMEQTTEKAGKSFESIQKVSARLDSIMKENQEEIAIAVQDLSRTLTEIRAGVEKNRPRVGAAAKSLKKATQQLKNIVGDIRQSWPSDRLQKDAQNWSRTLSDLQEATERSNQLAGSLQETSGNLDDMINRNRSAVRESLQDLAQAAKNLKDLTAKLKSRPSAVLFGGDAEKRELD